MKISAVVMLEYFRLSQAIMKELWFCTMSVSSFFKYRIFTHLFIIYYLCVSSCCRAVFFLIYGVVIFEKFKNILSFFSPEFDERHSESNVTYFIPLAHKSK